MFDLDSAGWKTGGIMELIRNLGTEILLLRPQLCWAEEA